MRCIIGHSYTDVGGFGEFDVVVTNPSGNVVRFTLQDTVNRVTQIRLVQALLKSAIVEWLADNRAALDANGDTAITGPDTRYPGDGFPNFVWNYGGKYGQITVTDLYGLDVSETYTVDVPYEDVI